jgi:hypothetical protein
MPQRFNAVGQVACADCVHRISRLTPFFVARVEAGQQKHPSTDVMHHGECAGHGV